MSLLHTILSFLVALTVLIYVHEMGHYLAARWYDVKVLRFSIGFGKSLFSWRYGPDQTEWSIGMIPLGGYVKMVDERDTETPIPPADLPRAFTQQSLGKRSVIVAAGPIANFLLAILLFGVINWIGVSEPVAVVGQPPAQSAAAKAGFIEGDRVMSVDGSALRSWYEIHVRMLEPTIEKRAIPFEVQRGDRLVNLTLDTADLPDGAAEKPTFVRDLGIGLKTGDVLIKEVLPDGAAGQGGMQPGDRFISIQGEKVRLGQDVIRLFTENVEKETEVIVDRAGSEVALNVTPAKETDRQGNPVGRIGVRLDINVAMEDVRYGLLESLSKGASKTLEWTLLTLRLFGKMLVGDLSVKNISGPITIADKAGESAAFSWYAYIGFLAIISISLGVLNLLPVPVLDGGHLVYYALEAIKGKPLSDRFMDITQRMGVVAIMALMVLAIFNDISRLVG